MNASGQMRVNVWQRGVAIYDARLMTKSMYGLIGLALIGFTIAALRMYMGLGKFSGMTDVYAWGIWKTFNVMTLTALGSGGLSVGIATWVFNRTRLHVVMRTAMVTSLILYTTGLIGILVDIGRPWNAYWLLMPWKWNMHSAMLEIMVCMPLYAFVFLAFENVPTVLGRIEYFGRQATRERLRRWTPWLRAIYPYMVAGAYLLPIMHQSSLGALMLAAGPKVHPLWQSQLLPLLYVLQAGICGFAFVIVALLTSCAYWSRPLDREVLGELGASMGILTLVWAVLRIVDVAVRGQIATALSLDFFSILFLSEFLLTLVPAVILLAPEARSDPRTLFHMTMLILIAGMAYRFIPTTVAYQPGAATFYFPSVAELFIAIGLISLAIIGYLVAVTCFGVLPAPASEWYELAEYWRRAAPSRKLNEHGYPVDD